MRARPTPLRSTLACLLLVASNGCGDASKNRDGVTQSTTASDATPAPVTGSLPAQGDLPEVDLASLRGGPALFVVEGRESMEKGQSKELKLALDRWSYPPELRAFLVADGRPYRFIPGLKDMAAEFLNAMRPELRLPMYADFQGDALNPLGVESGAFELVVVDASGIVAHRHRGDAEAEDIEAIRLALSASEPPPPPAAPPFQVGELNNAACGDRGCIFVFLGTHVERSEIPGLKSGGFEGSREDAFAMLKKPPIRLLSQVATRWDYEPTPIRGAIIGDGPADLLPAWQHIPAAQEAREAFGLAPDTTALVTVDTQGRLAFLAEDSFPFWRLGQARESVGLRDIPWER